MEGLPTGGGAKRVLDDLAGIPGQRVGYAELRDIELGHGSANLLDETWRRDREAGMRTRCRVGVFNEVDAVCRTTGTQVDSGICGQIKCAAVD